MNKTISCDKTSLEFKSTKNEHQTIIVSVDGDNTNNSYDVVYTENWFHINRNRNILEVIVNDNYTEYERESNIVCYHKSDQNVMAVINIKQNADTFNIKSSVNTITFKPIFEKPFECEEKLIVVTVNGGSKKFYVKEIEQFNNNGDVDRKISYDNGLITTINDNVLKVKSYGMVFLDDNTYYNLVIAHRDNVNLTHSIKVNYSSVPDTYRITKNIANNKILLKSIPLKNDNIKTKYNETNKIDDDKTKEFIKGTILEDKKSILFETFPVDSMIACTTTAKWCNYRVNKHLIEIFCNENQKNVWGIDRKCILKVFNAENPSLYVKYFVINKNYNDNDGLKIEIIEK